MSEITQVQGLAELDRLLKELPARLEGTVVRGGLRAGAVVLQNAAKQNVPVKSGALRRSIKVSTGIKKGRVYSRVRAGDKVAFYAHMVEFGTAGHKIAAKKGGMLNFGGRLVKSVDHPGARQRPFMRPAIDGKQGDAVEAMRAYIEARTPREVEKLKAGR
jgi:HK97 gp10 family phage protein